MFEKSDIIINYTFQNLDLSFFYVSLQGFHIEVIKLSEIEVEFAHILDGFSEIIVLEGAIENDVIAQLGKLYLIIST